MMYKTTARTTSPSRRRGLSLVEVLLCASIGTMLLTAVALAFRASFNSYKDNQQRGQMLNSVRGFVNTITNDIRMGDVVFPYDPVAAVNTSENNQFNALTVPGNPTGGLSSAGGSGIDGVIIKKTHADTTDPSATAANPIFIAYWLDSTTQQIYMTRHAGSMVTTNPTVMCKYVQNLQLYLLPLYVPPNPQSYQIAGTTLRRASVVVTLANKDANGARILADAGQDLTLVITDSAVPRRNFPGL